VRGAWTTARTDHAAKLTLRGLAPGRGYDATIWFEDSDGTASRPERISFSTAPIHPAATSFVWTGDTCGQEWGISQEYGGLSGFGAMLDVRPDFLVHCGDSIYADETMGETVVDYDGHVWRNEITESHLRPAQSLADYRARHRYPLGDDHVRRFHAAVPTIAQWDDHETTNNWFPGMVLDDERYAEERRCDVLAAYGRRAWQEYQPIAATDLANRGGDGFAARRIYRKISRGAHLDLFCVDQRSFRDPNSHNLEATRRALLGEDQLDWLIREVAASRATWKVISVDQPLSIGKPALDTGLYDSFCNGLDGQPLGRELELARLLSELKASRVRNVVFLTADVHYTAAHHYRPERAVFTDFDPFWEFVAGPIHASTFPVKELDPTFGGEVVFANGTDGDSFSPRMGKQFFGHVEIAADGRFRVKLRNTGGEVLWSRDLEPESEI